MKKLNTLSVAIWPLILSIIGFIFSLMFQSMAYWGHDKALKMELFWLGAIFAYICSIIAIFMSLKMKKIKLNKVDKVIRLISSILITLSLVLTTFLIIAWQSGF